MIALAHVRRTADWDRWRELATGAPPFLAPEFFALAAPLADGDPVIAEAWSPGALRGALPLVRAGDTLRSLRCDHSPAFDACGDADAIAPLWHALARDRGWHRIVLDKVRDDSPLARRLPELARADGCPVVLRPDGRHLYLALDGFEAQMNAKFRANLARCERKAGGVTFERIVSPSRADVDAALAIEAMAWKGAARTAITADTRVEHLYRALLRWTRHASISFITAGGRRIATLISVEDARTIYALKIGYDPSFAQVSPGHLMILHAARDAAARGKHELDFVGREDEWKHKWTERAHRQVAITIYRRSPRGLAGYWLRERVRPRLPANLRAPLPRGCQRGDLVGDHPFGARTRVRIERGLGLRRALRRTPAPSFGAPSTFAPGSWVRVRDAATIRATLDERDRLRGLAFVPAQWTTCGRVYRVAKHVRRIRDDHGAYRAITRTVMLEGVDCTAEGGGCGRHCPLFYRDEWLEPAAAPRPITAREPAKRHARVRDLDEIERGLDLAGRRDGVTFMPEMAIYAGKRLAIAGVITKVFEDDRWLAPPRPIYLLDGARCVGARRHGPCDRACALLWHEDWLVIDPDRPDRPEVVS
ncbi:MAG TPA: GNAT family N-acetyltransferase [Kofleriaceae bacterium]|nr:GNAT family N-acetyltransferase [Kofleriaceae bacterium]